jgi:adenosine deaminase
MIEYLKRLPKVELHAHLNGSLSLDTLRDLGLDLQVELLDLKDFFKLFPQIYSLTDTKDKIKEICNKTIQEFKKDSVIYLELRSTPRSSPRMTMDEYVEGLVESTPLSGIKVNWILSMDRRFSLEKNSQILELALKYAKYGVKGVDVCGDPNEGDLRDLIPLLKRAKDHGLYVTVHLGEISHQDEEISQVLASKLVDRIGHGTFLDGNEVKSLGIPIEICLTSNLKCKIVKDIATHHFHDFHMDDHPVILCTDDKGIFLSDLSQEYFLASKAFNLGKKELFDLAYKSVEYIFDTEDVKQDLRSIFKEFEAENL